jgi:hypothetical protein
VYGEHTVGPLLHQLGSGERALLDALARRGVPVPEVDPPTYRPLRGFHRIAESAPGRRSVASDPAGSPVGQAPRVTTSTVRSMASSSAPRAGVAASSSSRRRRAARASARVRASQGTPNGASRRWKATPRQPP